MLETARTDACAGSLQECSSIGRAPVSKTGGRRFEPCHSCQRFQRLILFAPVRLPRNAGFSRAVGATLLTACGKCHGARRSCRFGGRPNLMLHWVLTAAQNCSVTAVVSSVALQPFASAFSFANFCSDCSIFLISA